MLFQTDSRDFRETDRDSVRNRLLVVVVMVAVRVPKFISLHKFSNFTFCFTKTRVIIVNELGIKNQKKKHTFLH